MRERVDERIGRTMADVVIPQGWKDKMAEMQANRAQQDVERSQRQRAAAACRGTARVLRGDLGDARPGASCGGPATRRTR
jgi:hypothetical protein